ncbi:Mov34/MPN/PAD-1 family protein [Coleofasciculus chthonoplastes]|uniref:Mov34/MPN/PAD-1 family protein n=1 Tax=Coleofasciculus chthonoplastes TaxID=64178 RepID=UPI0002DF3DAC|nr:Mov34/MPN/PAD-1 family protein [Coleofasciculus chthonoplastes]
MNNTITLPPLVQYLTAQSDKLPPIHAQMVEYVIAGNGVFKRGKRVGLEVMIPMAECPIVGLAPIQPYFHLDYPKVPEQLFTEMLVRSQEAYPNEILFYLYGLNGQWQLDIPAQTATPTSVQPVLGASYHNTLIEVHSHPTLSADFSSTDDADETGFRIFGVLGTLFSQPTFRLRVGLYGDFWHIPAHWIFQMPQLILDRTTEKQ